MKSKAKKEAELSKLSDTLRSISNIISTAANISTNDDALTFRTNSERSFRSEYDQYLTNLKNINHYEYSKVLCQDLNYEIEDYDCMSYFYNKLWSGRTFVKAEEISPQYPYYEVVNADFINRIHDNSLSVQEAKNLLNSQEPASFLHNKREF